MKGSVLMGGILAAAAIMGGGMYYAIQYAPYSELPSVDDVSVGGELRAVSNYRAIDGKTSPLKFRACFEQDWGQPAQSEADATPLVGPHWFDCFDARQIQADLDSGEAIAILASENTPFGTNSYIATYGDGRAYMWRQLNDCGTAYFSADPIPADCPKPDGAVAQADVMVDPSQEIFKIKLTPVIGEVAEEIQLAENPVAAFSSDGKNYHSCFRVQASIAYLTETYEVADDDTPTTPLGNLPCFDATLLAADIKRGTAVAFLGQRNIVDGYDRFVAIYDDGRAFAWHEEAK